jgi:hypothetical protein
VSSYRPGRSRPDAAGVPPPPTETKFNAEVDAPSRRALGSNASEGAPSDGASTVMAVAGSTRVYTPRSRRTHAKHCFAYVRSLES